MNRDRSNRSDCIDIAAPQDAGGRLQTLDLLRGLTLISMIIYHGMWDFLYLSETGASMTALRTWYESSGHLWQQSICRTFILLSGFCVPFSRHIFRRGLQVSAGGAAVSAVTIIALYEERVLFGVLTFLGAAMLVTGGLKWICDNFCKKDLADGTAASRKNSAKGKYLPAAGLAVCLFFFHVTRWINLGCLRLGSRILLDLPAGLYTSGSGKLPGYIMTGLGFTMKGFFSTDYFSFLPWIFLFWGGLFLNRALSVQGHGKAFGSPAFHLQVPVLNLIGRHSLPVYLIHQPVLYLLITLLF